MHRRRVVPALLAAVLMIVAAACTRPKSQVETGGARVATGEGGSSDTSASGGGGGSGNSKVDQAIAKGDFGTLKQVCGGTKKAKVAPGTPGIQGKTISLGVFSDPGSQARPGLNQELFDASDVFVDWCNSVGGINGLRLKANHHDSALFNVKTKMIDACKQDFFLVGGGAVFDDSGEPTRLACLLPNVPGYVVSAASREADLLVQASPGANRAVNFGIARQLNDQFPESRTKVGFLTGNLPALTMVDGQYQEAGKHFGWKVVYHDQYNAAGEASWVPYAQKIKDAGVKGLFYTGEPENLGKLVVALGQLGYKLDWITAAANQYDVKLIKNGDGALKTDPVYVLDQFSPFDAKPQSPAVAEYEALFKKFKPNGKSHAQLGLNSFSAWLLFASGLRKCDTVSRKCVFDALKSVTKWDAGGLQAPANPASNLPSQCFVAMLAHPDKFTVEKWHANQDVFNCDSKNVVKLKGDYGKGTKLSSVGKSLADLK